MNAFSTLVRSVRESRRVLPSSRKRRAPSWTDVMLSSIAIRLASRASWRTARIGPSAVSRLSAKSLSSSSVST